MVVRPKFRDGALDSCLESRGYVMVPTIARAAVRPLRRVHRALVGRVPPGFHSTPYSDDLDHKVAVNAAIQAALLPVVDELLTGYRPLLASFISKGCDEGGQMPPHMDWTFVDEPMSASLNFWVPLVDVDCRNGAMSVLPGGHRIPHTIRGTGTDNPFAEIESKAAERMVEIPMRAGDVLIHDHRVLHASPPNRSRRPRVVAAVALVDEYSRAVHYWQDPGGVLARHVVDDRFFTDHTFGASCLPPSAHQGSAVEFRNPVLSAADLPVPETVS